MNMDKNIIYGKTLSEYKRKYRNCRRNLLFYSKEEVETFDAKFSKSAQVDKVLLQGRKWAYINGTYYEIPKSPSWTWFRNLNSTVQVFTCGLLGAGVVTAVVVPTVMAINKNGTRDVSIDEAIKHVKCESKMVDGNLEITLTPDEGYKVTGIKKISINSYELKNSEYSFENNKVTIGKTVLDNHSGKIIITPEVDVEGRKLSSIYVSSNPTKTKYYYKDKLDLDGLCIKSKYSDGSEEDITNDPEIVFDIEKDHEFTESDAERKAINITYKDKTTSFSIKYYLFNEYLNVVDASWLGPNLLCVSPKEGVELPKNLIIPQKMVNSKTNEENYIVELYNFNNKKDIEILDLSLIYDNIKSLTDDGYGLFINTYCFKDCTSLKKVILAPGLITIGGSNEGLFNNCTSLEEVDCIYSSTEINYYEHGYTGSFNGCKNLKTLVLNSNKVANYKTVDDGFDYTLYDHLEKVYVNKSITVNDDSYINNKFKFYGDSQTKEGYKEYHGKEFLFKDIVGNTCKIESGLLCNGKIDIPNNDGEGHNVTCIKSFINNKNITAVTFADSILSIDSNSFEGCSNLTDVKLNEGIKKINGNGYAFKGCTNLSTINIPSSFGNQESNPFGTDKENFKNCNSLSTIYLDSLSIASLSADKIDNSLFSNDPILYVNKNISSSITTGYIYTYYNSSTEEDPSGNYFKWTHKAKYTTEDNPDGTCTITGPGDGFSGGDIILPDSINGKTVSKLGQDAFKNKTDILSVVCNDSLKEIGAGCFNGCTSLNKIQFNSGLTTLGHSDEFLNCPASEVYIFSEYVASDENIGLSKLLSRTNQKLYIKSDFSSSMSKYIDDRYEIDGFSEELDCYIYIYSGEPKSRNNR